MEDVVRRVAYCHPYLRLHEVFRFVPRAHPSLPRDCVPVASPDQLRAGDRVRLVLPWTTCRYVVETPTLLLGDRTRVLIIPCGDATFSLHMLAGDTLVWGTLRRRLPLFRSLPRR
jgi:hypothetical protein